MTLLDLQERREPILQQQKKIGLIGGMSWHSTALYYERLNRAYESRLGEHQNFEGHVVNLQFARLLHAASADDWCTIEREIAAGARELAAAGCGVVALTAVTAHIFYAAAVGAAGVPVLHVLSTVPSALRKLGARKVGVLGTGATCKAQFIREFINQNGNNVLMLKPEPQAEIDFLIKRILTADGCRQEARHVLQRGVASLVDAGAQAILLACTELPLLLPLDHVSVPLIDAVALHVDQICEATLEPTR